jgi:hypothetical protein
VKRVPSKRRKLSRNSLKGVTMLPGMSAQPSVQSYRGTFMPGIMLSNIFKTVPRDLGPDHTSMDPGTVCLASLLGTLHGG